MMDNKDTQQELFVGIDGGGTKTNAFIINARDEILGQFITGSSNPNSVGNDIARSNLFGAIIGALSRIGQEPTSVSDSDSKADMSISDAVKAKLRCVSSVACGMSGCDTPADVAKMTGWLNDFFREQGCTPLPLVQVSNDSVCALASGTLGRLHGIVLICGTGMISWGRNNNAKDDKGAALEARSGGCGALIDGGSGYDIGRCVLRAIFHAAEGLGPATGLTAVVLSRLGLATTDDLLGWLYSDLSWARVADLARLAFEQDAQGDAVAHGIVEQAAGSLAAVVKCVARNIKATGEDRFPIVFAGSILREKTLATLVTADIQSLLPDSEIIYPKVEPAMGAALLAKFAKHPAL